MYSSGLVAVTLRNEGAEAYDFDKYGKEITIERRINADGGSSYCIKDVRGVYERRGCPLTQSREKII